MFNFKGLFTASARRTVDRDEEMSDAEDARIPGQFDFTPPPVPINPFLFQNERVGRQASMSTRDAATEQELPPLGSNPTADTTADQSHGPSTSSHDEECNNDPLTSIPEIKQSTTKPRTLGRRRHADLNNLPASQAQGSLSGPQDPQSQFASQSQPRPTGDSTNITSLTIRPKSSKRQLSASDKQSNDDTSTAPKDKVRVVSPNALVRTSYTTDLENMRVKLEDNLSRATYEQRKAEQRLLEEKKELEEKVERLMEEKEREFMQMKETAQQEQNAAVKEALEQRESEFLKEMHTHVASTRAEAEQMIARARVEVGRERERLQEQIDVRVSEAYKEAELKFNESMSRAIAEVERARQQAEDEKDKEIALLRQDYYRLINSTTIEPRLEAMEAQASAPHVTPISQPQPNTTVNVDGAAMDVDVPHNSSKDPVVLRYVQRRDRGKPKPLNVWLNQLFQAKDKPLLPPTKVPIPRTGNPLLHERAYMPEELSPLTAPASTMSGHSGRTPLLALSTSLDPINGPANMSSSILETNPEDINDHSESGPLTSSRPCGPTSTPTTDTASSENGRGDLLMLDSSSSDHYSESSPTPSREKVSDNAPPPWAEALIGTVQHLRTLVEGLEQQSATNIHRARRTRGVTGVFRVKHEPKYRDTDRIEMMNTVRKKMQALFGIKTDAEIDTAVMKGASASDEDVANWIADGSVSPSLHPINPYWNDLESPWNDTLADLFVAELTANSALDKIAVKDHFLSRLETLKKQLTAKVTLGSDEYDEKKQVERANNRRRTRRQSRFDTRILIANELAKANGEKQDPVWLAIHAMVDSLGIDGMSTDCSGDEQRFPATVITKDWRSRDVIDLLVHVDQNYNHYTGLGKLRSGSAPHARERRPNAPVSTRRALAGLPVNFYNQIWYDSLTDTEKRWLNAEPAVVLPRIVKETVGVVL